MRAMDSLHYFILIFCQLLLAAKLYIPQVHEPLVGSRPIPQELVGSKSASCHKHYRFLHVSLFSCNASTHQQHNQNHEKREMYLCCLKRGVGINVTGKNDVVRKVETPDGADPVVGKVQHPLTHLVIAVPKVACQESTTFENHGMRGAMYEGNGDDLLALDASLVDKLHHFDHIAALRCLAEVRYFQVRQVTLVYDGRERSL